MAAFWDYEENHADMEQLGQKLLYTTLELEKLKSESSEEMKKNNDYIKQLIHLLRHVIQERDEAKNQLHNLLNIPTLRAAGTSLVRHVQGNSSVTESNTISGTHNNHHSQGSSPVESLLDGECRDYKQSTEFSEDAGPVIFNHPVLAPRFVDRGELVMENLVKGRVLPQRGKFLQSVLQAGPLLQTLLVAGPLPRWRNPPQFQNFQIPPPLRSRALNPQGFGQVSCGSGQFQPAGLNFGDTARNGGLMVSPGINGNGYYAPLAKRQRFN